MKPNISRFVIAEIRKKSIDVKKKKYRCKYFESKGRTKTFNIQVKTLLEINIIKTKVGKRKE